MDTVADDFIFYFCTKLEAINKNNVNELNSVIDEINAVNIETLRPNDQVYQKILMLITQLMPARNDHLLSKYCHVIQLFCRKLKVVLSSEGLTCIVNHLITASGICGSWVHSDVLYALSTVLYKNVSELNKFHDILIGEDGILLKWMFVSDKDDTDLQLAAVKCLQSLTIRSQDGKLLSRNHLTLVLSKLISSLKEIIPKSSLAETTLNFKIILSCLKCLENIFSSKMAHTEELGDLLGILKALHFCGFPGQETVIPICLYPSVINFPQTATTSQHDKEYSLHFSRNKSKRNRSKKRIKKKGTEKLKKNIDEESDGNSSDNKASSQSTQACNWETNSMLKNSSSDSDFSDLEGSNALPKLKTSIRQHAYTVMQLVIKSTEKKVLFGYWSSFLPEPASSGPNFNNLLNLFTTILRDPSPQVRMCAVGAVAELFKGSKQFLSLVDDKALSKGSGSFTTASSVLTSMVCESHRCLLLALVAEKTPLLLTQILKCYVMLIDNIPYKRLNKDLLLKLLVHLKPLLTHKDCQVQVACLTVFGSLLQSDQVPEDIYHSLIQDHEENASDMCQIQNASNDDAPGLASCPWIIAICRNNILSPKIPSLSVNVIVESLQLLSVISGRHFHIIRNLMSLMQEIILISLCSTQSSLQLHGAKMLEVIGRGILHDLNTSVEESQSDLVTSDVAADLWRQVLARPLQACLMNNEQPTLRAACCDCLSTIPVTVFNDLPNKIQSFSITVLFGLSSDADQAVRGAAVRCLGIFALFSSLREDLSYLSSVAGILCEAIEDPVFIVRTKASWAMGNLTDALFLSRDEFPNFLHEVKIPFIYSIGMASVKATKDSDRVQTNAVRSLGNLLHFLNPEFLVDPQVQAFLHEAQLALTSALAAKVMKVSWNACYAIGSLFKNTELVTSKFINVEDLLRELLNVLHSPNFKVRINAVIALTTLRARNQYGGMFVNICFQLVDVLATAESDMNFEQMMHFRNLCDTVCFSVCQLLILATSADFGALDEIAAKSADILLMSMWKFGENTSAEKIVPVEDALLHIGELCVTDDVSLLRTLEWWQDVLHQARNAFLQK